MGIIDQTAKNVKFKIKISFMFLIYKNFKKVAINWRFLPARAGTRKARFPPWRGRGVFDNFLDKAAR